MFLNWAEVNKASFHSLRLHWAFLSSPNNYGLATTLIRNLNRSDSRLPLFFILWSSKRHLEPSVQRMKAPDFFCIFTKLTVVMKPTKADIKSFAFFVCDVIVCLINYFSILFSLLSETQYLRFLFLKLTTSVLSEQSLQSRASQGNLDHKNFGYCQ